MRIEQTLLQEIEESKKWFNIEKDDSTYLLSHTKQPTVFLLIV
jgi:hypothetical protein